MNGPCTGLGHQAMVTRVCGRTRWLADERWSSSVSTGWAVMMGWVGRFWFQRCSRSLTWAASLALSGPCATTPNSLTSSLCSRTAR